MLSQPLEALSFLLSFPLSRSFDFLSLSFNVYVCPEVSFAACSLLAEKTGDMADAAAAAETEHHVEMWKIKKLIKNLEAARG